MGSRAYSGSGSNFSYMFGPGPLTPAIKILVALNVGAFLLQQVVSNLSIELGLQPSAVLTELHVWTPVTYMFLHGGIGHILFNMLSLWMFGVELERMWGTAFFTRYYLVCGVGAAATTIVLAFLPGEIGQQLYYSVTIGASGAIYGVLLAYAMYFPNRPIYMYFFFPIPAKYFVMILGALAFWISPGSGVSNSAHLGGLLFGYLYLKGKRTGGITAEIKYRYLKWKMNRLRRKFDVYSGGRGDWDRHIH